MIRSNASLPLLFTIALVSSGCLAASGTTAPEGQEPWLDAERLEGDTPLAQGAAALVAADTRLFGSADALPAPRATDLLDTVRAFATDHDHQITATEAAGLARLTALPGETALALADVIEAFRLLETTTADAFADPSAPRLDQAARAQHVLVDAAVVLEAALATYGTGIDEPVTAGLPAGTAADLPLATSTAPILVGSLLAIDISGAADTHWRDVHLLIDVGGNDVYHNNAGGTGLTSDHCRHLSLPDPTSARAPTVAALIDLAGDDSYEMEESCGKAGGASWGVGTLIDAAGDDRYKNGGLGTNGGATAQGLGLLLDAAGNDVYEAGGAGTNGGGFAGGVGRLIDRSGDDAYTATTDGANGGARRGTHCYVGCIEIRAAQGLLLDLAGTDVYNDFILKGAVDQTVIPKEFYGAQVDIEFDPAPPAAS